MTTPNTGVLEMTITPVMEALLKGEPFYLGSEMSQGGRTVTPEGMIYYKIFIEDEKKCTLIKEFILRVLATQAENYILSLKHTHKNDKWFTFWRADQRGYCWFGEWMGVYNDVEVAAICAPEQGTPESCISFKKSVIDALLVSVEYEGKTYKVLPNNASTRKILGLQTANLTKKHKSN